VREAYETWLGRAGAASGGAAGAGSKKRSAGWSVHGASGARLLCSQHVLGQSEGRRVEIQFSLYATKRRPSETARFYAKAHAVPWKAGSETITVKAAEGRKLLTVHAVSAPHPSCGVEPHPEDRTVIVVSEKVP